MTFPKTHLVHVYARKCCNRVCRIKIFTRCILIMEAVNKWFKHLISRDLSSIVKRFFFVFFFAFYVYLMFLFRIQGLFLCLFLQEAVKLEQHTTELWQMAKHGIRECESC